MYLCKYEKDAKSNEFHQNKTDKIHKIKNKQKVSYCLIKHSIHIHMYLNNT